MPKQKRRPERQRPGLKQQTPHEKRLTREEVERIRKRWEHLFSLNAWKPTP